MATAAKLGALWLSKAKSDKAPALTGEIDGQRVVGFKNKRWSEDNEKQPLYQLYKAVSRKTD